MARPCSSSWHCPDPGLGVTSLPAWLWDSGTHGEVATTPNPRPGRVQLSSQAPCATVSPKLPLLCPPLSLVHGVWVLGLTPVSPCSLVPMADLPLLRCGPCHLERVGRRAGRRSRRLPGKAGLIPPPLCVPRELQGLPGHICVSPLTLRPHKGPPRVVGTPFAAVPLRELYAVNKLFH